MDLWNASHAGAVPVRARPMESGVATAMGRRKGVTAEQQWMQVTPTRFFAPIMDCMHASHIFIFFIKWKGSIRCSIFEFVFSLFPCLGFSSFGLLIGPVLVG